MSNEQAFQTHGLHYSAVELQSTLLAGHHDYQPLLPEEDLPDKREDSVDDNGGDVDTEERRRDRPHDLEERLRGSVARVRNAPATPFRNTRRPIRWS